MKSGLARWLAGRTPAAFIVRACVLLGVLSAVQLAPAFEDHVSAPLRRLDARVTHWALALLGVETTLRDSYVLNTEFGIEVIDQCTGIAMATILVSLTLAFPARWSARLWGVVLGLAVIYTANIVRLSTLFLIGMRWPQIFEDVHKLVWQGALILVVFVYWFAWASRVTPDAAGAERAA